MLLCSCIWNTETREGKNWSLFHCVTSLQTDNVTIVNITEPSTITYRLVY